MATPHLIVSVSFNFHSQGYHPSVKINTTKSLSAVFETGKRICFSACLEEIDVAVGVLLQNSR